MRTLLPAVLISLCVVAGCSKNPATTQTDYLEGNCVGMVKDAAGSPAPGASLMLVPEGYSPLATGKGSLGNTRIDSTVSDEYGRYAFFISAPGAYNLLAKSKGLYAMRRPIHISSDARVILDDEILKEPGSFSGKVHLQAATNHGAAIILFLGTTIFTMPSDSTGAFSVAALAQGSYTLRFLTAENSYAVVETTITIASGMHTALPCIDLQKKFVPIIDSLSVNYDPLMMLAFLTWPAVDTAKIRNYAVYCNRSKNLSPIAAVGKGVTACTLDIISSPLDTFQYQISAIDKDGIEGPPAMGKLFVKHSAIASSKLTCAMSFVNAVPFNLSSLYFDRHNNIFVTSHNNIIKLDSAGTVVGEFFPSDDTSAANRSFRGIRIDTAGNIFALMYPSCSSVSSCSSKSLIKISNDLKLIREIPIDNVQRNLSYSIAVSAAGAVALYASYYNREYDTVGYGTHIWIYDPQFTMVKTDSTPEGLIIGHSIICNDTTIGFVWGNTMNNDRIVYFDAAFNVVASPVTFDYDDNLKKFSSFIPQGYSSSGPRFLGCKDLFAFEYYAGTDSPLLYLIVNDHMRPVARLLFVNSFPYGIFFDCKGNLYGFSATENNVILKYSLAKVLGAVNK